MRVRLMQVAGLACLLAALGVQAADEKAKAPKVDYDKIAEAGPGVYKVEMDKQGRIESCLVVGQSRISTVLGVSKGKEVARQRADLAANAEFVKWLKTEVSVHQKSDDETILFLEGREDNDKDALRESGKAIEKTTATFEATAKGLVHRLQVVHIAVNGKDKTYSLVKKWKAKTGRAVKGVERDLKDTGSEAGKKPPVTEDGGDKKTPGGKKPGDKKIEDKKITIDDCDD